MTECSFAIRKGEITTKSIVIRGRKFTMIVDKEQKGLSEGRLASYPVRRAITPMVQISIPNLLLIKDDISHHGCNCAIPFFMIHASNYDGRIDPKFEDIVGMLRQHQIMAIVTVERQLSKIRFKIDRFQPSIQYQYRNETTITLGAEAIPRDHDENIFDLGYEIFLPELNLGILKIHLSYRE